MILLILSKKKFLKIMFHTIPGRLEQEVWVGGFIGYEVSLNLGFLETP